MLVDYRLVFRLREAAAALAGRSGGQKGAGEGNGKGNGNGHPNGKPGSRLAGRAVASGFAWMFSGARFPAPRLVDAGLAIAERWANNRRA